MNTRVMLKRDPASNLAHRARDENFARKAFVERARESAGQSLDATTRERMETRLGHHFARLPIFPAPKTSSPQIVGANDATERAADEAAREISHVVRNDISAPRVDFSSVRVHTDAFAQNSARALNALAFTLGRDIFFDAGQYAPYTRAGEQLLAHELTHVLQQSRTHNAFVLIQRKETNKALPPADALQVALNGDDDATRDLTNNPAWEDIALDEKQSATLVIHLLDGFTGDDDERAGLKILDKNNDHDLLDATLLELDHRNRFGQLLDDYDGSEYRELLELLSDNIVEERVKARYLDEFISMWWVREHEERAIVDLLDRTDDEENVRLLTQKGRARQLRDAIDTEKLKQRFEKILKSTNIKRGELLSVELQRIFEVKARESVGAGKYTQEEVDEFLKDAAADVAAELLAYAERLDKITTNPNVPSVAIEYANRQVEKRLDELIREKSFEFDLELKYSVEFNSSLQRTFGKQWTRRDLEHMDKDILQFIPLEILQGNPRYIEFFLEKSHPDEKWLGGFTGYKDVTLISASLYTAAHELGHVVHNLEPKLLEEFQKISGWEAIDPSNPAVSQRRLREPEFDKLLTRLDAKRADTASSPTPSTVGEKFGDGFFYLINRYGTGYFRYPIPRPEGGNFVSEYAATHPHDDFAETFRVYIQYPKDLRAKPYMNKFKFMYLDVFVGFWLTRQGDRVRRRFDQIADPVLDTPYQTSEANEFLESVEKTFVEPLRARMEHDLDTLRQRKLAEQETIFEHTPKSKPLQKFPLAGSKDVEQHSAPFLAEIRDLLALAKRAGDAVEAFGVEMEILGVFADPNFSFEFSDIASKLRAQFRDDAAALLNPLAQRVLQGEHIVMPTWNDLDALQERYTQARQLMDAYFPTYQLAGTTQPALLQVVRDAIVSLGAGHPKDKEFRTFAVTRLREFREEMNALRDEMVRRMRAGTRYQDAPLADPQQRFEQAKTEIETRLHEIKK